MEDEKKEFRKAHGYWLEKPAEIVDLITAGIKDQPYDTPEDVEKNQGHLKLPLQHRDGDCPTVSRATICSGKLIVEPKRSFAPNPSIISQQRLLERKSGITVKSIVYPAQDIRGTIKRTEGQVAQTMRQYLEYDSPKEVKGYMTRFAQWLRS